MNRGPRIRAVRKSATALGILLLAGVVAACSGQDAGSALDTPAATANPREGTAQMVASGGRVETTVGADPSAEAAGERAAGAGHPFSSNPEAGGGAGYGADMLLGVRYGRHAGYERVVLDLGTGRTPAATVPEWTLASHPGGGLLRVTLPSVTMTGVSDGRLQSDLLRGFYVARATDGGIFVDVFARRGFDYRVMGLPEPSRLVVDFRPNGSTGDRPPPAVGGNTVLIEPRAGARVSGPLTISGYSRNPEGVNTVSLAGPDGETLLRSSIRANDWTETWGYFEATLEPSPFSGRGTLRVGAQSARDGRFSGVEVPLSGS